MYHAFLDLGRITMFSRSAIPSLLLYGSSYLRFTAQLSLAVRAFLSVLSCEYVQFNAFALPF